MVTVDYEICIINIVGNTVCSTLWLILHHLIKTHLNEMVEQIKQLSDKTKLYKMETLYSTLVILVILSFLCGNVWISENVMSLLDLFILTALY